MQEISEDIQKVLLGNPSHVIRHAAGPKEAKVFLATQKKRVATYKQLGSLATKVA